jgi:indole-3-glycerol phosphate synthase
VAESGIHAASEAKMLREHGIAAMLVGESLMRQADIATATRKLLDTGIPD